MPKIFSLIVLALVVNNVFANQAAPYAGQEQRVIKSLSVDEIESYLNGKGAGLAKAAELNHYPGPAHVLELADQLELSSQQRTRTEAIFKAMQADAIRWGHALVDKEQELDRRFASAAITPEELRALLEQIGNLQTEVRRAHLQAHLQQRAILNREQVAKYDRLRGYGSGSGPGHRGHSGH